MSDQALADQIRRDCDALIVTLESAMRVDLNALAAVVRAIREQCK